MTASRAAATGACNADRGSPPSCQGLQASRNIGSGIGMDGPAAAFVAGIHCIQKVTDLGAAYLTHNKMTK